MSDFDIIMVLSLPTPAARGGGGMEYIANFFVSVIANVVASCVSKWLDRHHKEQ